MWSRKCGRWRVRCRCERRRFAVEVTRYCAAGNDGSVSGRGVGRRAAGEAQRGCGAPVGAVRRWSVMGGAGLRGAHTERWCAGVVGGAGLAGGEVSEDSLDDLASSLRERHFRGVSMHAMTRSVPPHTHTTVFDVDVEDALEALHPAHGGRRRMGFAGGSMNTVGDDVVAVYEVRGEHAVVSGEMGAGARHRASSLRERRFRDGEAGDAKSAGLPICTAGGCPEGVRHTDVPHEFHRGEHDMSRPVVEGVLEWIHDLPRGH